MRENIHPKYKEIKVVCSCGNSFVTRSTMEKDQLTLEVCSNCHPFYTGTQKIVDTAGRVDRFRQKYGMRGKGKGVQQAQTKEAESKAESKTESKAKEAKEDKQK